MLRDKFNRTDIVLAISVIILVMFLITILLIPPTTFYTAEFDDFSITLPSYTFAEEIPDGALITSISDSAEIIVKDYSAEEFEEFNSNPLFLEDVYEFNDTHYVIDIDTGDLFSDDDELFLYCHVIVPKKDFDPDAVKLKADTKLIIIKSLNPDYRTFIENNAEFGG